MSKESKKSEVSEEKTVEYVSFKDLNLKRQLGKVLTGKFAGTYRKTMYNQQGEPFLAISHGFESEDGSKLTVVNNVRSLEDGLAKIGVRKGDTISISYDGMVPKTNSRGTTNNVHAVKVSKSA
jgi:hypothetical protein